MTKAVLWWISGQEDREDPRLHPFLEAAEKEVALRVLAAKDLSEHLDQEADDRVIGTIITPSVQRPVATARRFLRRFPGREVLFISGVQQGPSPKRDVNLAFLYGHHRTISPGDVEEGTRAIRRLLGQARRQRRFRWALKRMNEQIAQAGDEKARQKRLSISDRLLVSILAQSPDALFVLDLHGFVLTANRAAMANYELGEAEGSHFDDTPLAEELPELKELVAKATRSEEICRREIATSHRGEKEPQPVSLEASASPVFHEDNSLIGITVLLRDVSPLKMAEQRLREMNEALENRVNERTQELKEANRQMEGFLYSVAHDLRAPLRAIAGFTQILQTEHGAEFTSDAQELMRRVTGAALRMDRLVHDLLAYSRVAKIVLPLQPVKLDEAIETARSAVAEQIADSDAEIEIQPARGAVLAHRTTLEQAIINLISNALKYSRPNEPLRIRVFSERKKGRYRLWIEDNGIGIEPSYHEKIFGIFERVAIASHPSGTGIGLAIVKGGVERMGGTVGVESQPGKGSSFWIELPAAPRGDS